MNNTDPIYGPLTAKAIHENLPKPPVNLEETKTNLLGQARRHGDTSKEKEKEKVSEGSIEATLAERGARYGAFREYAVIAQDIQNAMRKPPGWNRLAPYQKQALTVIADKIARMLNGDPNYVDNWHDIIGYAKLVEDRLTEKVTSGNSEEKK